VTDHAHQAQFPGLLEFWVSTVRKTVKCRISQSMCKRMAIRSAFVTEVYARWLVDSFTAESFGFQPFAARTLSVVVSRAGEQRNSMKKITKLDSRLSGQKRSGSINPVTGSVAENNRVNKALRYLATELIHVSR